MNDNIRRKLESEFAICNGDWKFLLGLEAGLCFASCIGTVVEIDNPDCDCWKVSRFKRLLNEVLIECSEIVNKRFYEEVASMETDMPPKLRIINGGTEDDNIRNNDIAF